MDSNKEKYDIDILITEYVSGEIDASDFGRLEEWATASEENREYVRMRIEELFSAGTAASTADFDVEQAYRRFEKRVAATGSGRTKRRALRAVIAAAAVVLAMLLPLAGYWAGGESVKSDLAEIHFETGHGSPLTVTLPDGTKVWLNADSKITCPQGFGVNGRSLSLTGEACFDVAHNDDLPFHVKTEELNLEVLGTKFTFRDYPDESKATVDLIRGKVALSDNIRPENKMSLKPNERMTFDKRTGRMTKSGVNANYSDTWARGVLFFDEMPLGEIAKAIERRFNVRIYVADYLKNKKFYGMFNTEKKSAADILEAMSKTNRMKYKYENGHFYLY